MSKENVLPIFHSINKLYFYKIKIKLRLLFQLVPQVDEQKWDMYNLARDADGAK